MLRIALVAVARPNSREAVPFVPPSGVDSSCGERRTHDVAANVLQRGWMGFMTFVLRTSKEKPWSTEWLDRGG